MVERGAISAGYLSGIKARILLMVGLAQTSDREAIREFFARVGGSSMPRTL
jgi:L-asparaginase/Glu-tRNA(Gln) amidotransferase subunit D